MAFREIPFLLAAAMLHLAVPVATRILPRPLAVRPLLAAHRLSSTEILVDVAYDRRLEWPRELPPDAVPFHDSRSLARHTIVPEDRWRPTPRPEDTSNPLVEPPPESPVSPEGPSPPPSDYDAPPVIDGVNGTWGWPGGGRSWALTPGGRPHHRSEAAPTETQPRRPTDPRVATQVIEQGIQQKDRTLGLDLPAAAAVAAVVGGAVRAAETPADCVARVAVALGSDGRVQSVSLLSFSGGDSAAWHQVARAARAELASRTFALRSPFTKGAIITVSVRSRMRLPSGSGGREGLTFTFDPSNIGARPKRLVTTSVSVQAVP